MNKIIVAILLLVGCASWAQEKVHIKKYALQGFNVSGNYRFYGQHRYMTTPYAIDIVEQDPTYLEGRNIMIGDATQLPELTLNIGGNPTSKTSFGTDIVVWNQNNGDFDYYRNLQLGINLYGSFSTDFSNINVRAGGLHWHRMTPFTMGAFAGYNRYSVFERNPWDPQFKEMSRRYEDYLDRGAITQDERWANQAVQGVIIDLTELPLGFSINALYGKTQNASSAFTNAPLINTSSANNFVGNLENTIPNNVYAGSIHKKFKAHYVRLNTFNRRTYSDALATELISNSIYTSDFSLVWSNLMIQGEAGLGRYSNVLEDLGYGEMVSLKFNFSKELTKIPFEIHAFRISPNVVNSNAEFVNTSISEMRSAASGEEILIGANGVLQQNGSAMLGLGQMANNRQGVNLNVDFKIKNLNVVLGSGVSKEIENKNNTITYGHAINGLTISRFWRWSFPSDVGPYNRTSVLYRGVFETVVLTDLSDNGEVVNDKNFNNMEGQLKYKFKLFSKPWYFFYLGMYNSVQPDFSPITVFTEDAYIRYYAHQLENYYEIHPKLVLCQYLGWERVVANYSTKVDIESLRPRNQEGIALGFGLDYMMAKNTGLYLRHRYFSFEDRSYGFDVFSGFETTIEIKLFF